MIAFLVEYLERNVGEDEDGVRRRSPSSSSSSSSSDSSSSSSTYEGVSELFVERAATVQNEELAVAEMGRRIRTFRVKVLAFFEGEKEMLQRRIRRAFDAQEAIQDLDTVDPEAKGQSTRVATLIEQIRMGGDLMEPGALAALGRQLDSIAEGLSVLSDLTSVKEEDAVTCAVCLDCPGAGVVIWDCGRCGGIFCDLCRVRLTACPICRGKFKSPSSSSSSLPNPRRNRWAEKMARMQREKEAATRAATTE